MTIKRGVMKKKKIVVQFIEAGQGHIVTAEAIAECLEKKYSDKIEVVRDYAFRDSGDKTLEKYEKFSINEVYKANRNKLHFLIQYASMKVFGEMSSLKFVYSTVFKKARNKLIKRMQSYDADMIVSTYFMTYHTGVVAKKKGLINAEIVAYDPDHNVHGWWDRRGDLFIVNNKSAKKEAIEVRKMPKDKVVDVNFMARQIILDTNGTKDYYRGKLGIPNDKLVVLLADGAYAAAKLEDYTDALLQSDKPLTIIPVCGKNEKVYQKYMALKDKTKPNITLMPQPFLTNIPEYYKAADIFVTKGGPNAITDCVFMGTPVMINFYSGPIEETTMKIMTEEFKCGINMKNVKDGIAKIESWVDDRTELDELARHTSALDKNKNGAEEIADILAQRVLKGEGENE